MTNVLDDILRAKREEVTTLQKATAVRSDRTPLSVERALRSEPNAKQLKLITEIKRRSPSAGPLSTALSVADRALAYARGGAAMISVLCDAQFFDGSFVHVREARAALDAAGLDVPILAKEFVIDERQIDEAATYGADAVLLIVRIVPDASQLEALCSHAVVTGLTPFVEVVTEEELRVVLELTTKAPIIGVNARDLDTLEMDADRAARVLAMIPSDRIPVHLSGLKTPDDVATVARSRSAAAALVGEALMRLDDPSPLLSSMLNAALR